MAKILRCVLGLVKTVVLGVAIDGDAIVVSVRPHKRERLRCPVCGRRCDCHDHEPTRRWRAMDLARSKCYLEYRPARVRCPEHGVLVERVPRAHGVGGRTDRKPLYVSCPPVRTRQGRPTDRGTGSESPCPPVRGRPRSPRRGTATAGRGPARHRRYRYRRARHSRVPYTFVP